jgi:hypothetical protein
VQELNFTTPDPAVLSVNSLSKRATSRLALQALMRNVFLMFD